MASAECEGLALVAVLLVVAVACMPSSCRLRTSAVNDSRSPSSAARASSTYGNAHNEPPRKGRGPRAMTPAIRRGAPPGARPSAWPWPLRAASARPSARRARRGAPPADRKAPGWRLGETRRGARGEPRRISRRISRVSRCHLALRDVGMAGGLLLGQSLALAAVALEVGGERRAAVLHRRLRRAHLRRGSSILL